MIISILIVIACVSASLVIIAASLLRCRKCGRWHDCVEDEKECNGK